MRATLKQVTFVATLLVVATLVAVSPTFVAASQDKSAKLDRALKARAQQGSGYSRVIVRLTQGASASTAASTIRRAGGGALKRQLVSISSHVAVVPNTALPRLAEDPAVAQISLDREIVGAMERTGLAVGAVAARQQF